MQKRLMLRVLFIGALLVLTRGLTAQPAAPAPTPQTLPLEERVLILSKTYSAIQLYFAQWQDAPRFNLDVAYQQLLPEALKTEDRFQFALLMDKFVHQLHNAHCWYADIPVYRESGQPLGFELEYLDRNWVVTSSTMEALHPGDIVKTIDGQAFDAFFEGKYPYLDVDNERQGRIRLNHFSFLFPEKFVLGLADGRAVSISRTHNPWPAKEILAKWIRPGDVAYLRIPTFSRPDILAKAEDAVKSFQNARVLIVDVRGNEGGTTPKALIDMLIDRPYRFWRQETPMHLGLFQSYDSLLSEADDRLPQEVKGALEGFSEVFHQASLAWNPQWEAPKSTVFKGKLIILDDRRCISAGEDFIEPFKDNGRAVIVGEPTFGSTGQPFMCSLGDGIQLGVCTVRDTFPDGTPFEGVGIVPDVAVGLTPEDLKAGKDPVLEKAIQLAGTAKAMDSK